MRRDHPALDRVREVVEEFSLFEDWTGRYEHLIEQARRLAPLDPAYRTDPFRVHGCQSQVWVAARLERGLGGGLNGGLGGGRVRFVADSDALITRGLVALLVRVFDDLSPDDVSDADVEWLTEIGMQDHLSSTRKNGLDAMVRRMKSLAAAFAQDQPSNQAP